MKWKTLTYLITSLLAISTLMISCDGDETTTITKDVEGYWVYMDTKADVYVTEPEIKESIENYIITRNDAFNISYEFKNDKTYYYYQNFAEPLKGKYNFIDKTSLILDDSRGNKLLSREDSLIYLVTDLRDEIAQKLGIDKNKIIKANATDIFERGLFTD